MELYKKYRPQKLIELAGNQDTVKILSTFLKAGNLPHSLLITGPKGCGKTTIGRILKNELKCDDFDFKELDTGIFRGIDTVRDIRKQLEFSPMKSPCRVWLLDEVHMLGRGGDSGKNEAQNALLKALEDTPNHVYFILCTTNPEMLLSTIRSRCVEIKVEALTAIDMLPLLKKILKAENKVVDKAVLMRIVRYSEGSCRNALQLLDKVIAADLPVEEAKKLVMSESIDQKSQVNELCQAMLKAGNWGQVKKVLQGLKTEDPESIRRQIIGYAGAVLLNGNEAASVILGWFLYKNTYDSGFPLITQFCYNITQGIEPPC